MSNAEYAMLLFYALVIKKKWIFKSDAHPFLLIAVSCVLSIPVLHHCSNMFIGIPWKQVVVEDNNKRC